MKIPRISVVIPTYNTADFIEEALASVFNQTFQGFEIIVVDDGSTDDTRNILEKYKNRVRYCFQENSGPAKARNHGIGLALGEFIAFLDADDIWMPTKLEKQISLFDQRKHLGMLTTGVCSFDEKGDYGFSANKRSTLMQGDIARNIFLHSNIGTPTVMVRKEVFDNIGLFEENIRQAEDDNMWIRIAAHYDIELIDEALVKIRNHPQRMTLNKTEVLECVLSSIMLLKTKYGERVTMKIEKAIPIKISHVQFAIGYGFYERGNYHEARRAFAKGAYQWIWFWKNPVYLLLSLIPPGLTELLQSFKRKLTATHTNGSKRRK